MLPTDLVRPSFSEPFGEGLSRTPRDLTPTAWLLDAIMRRTLLPRMGYREGLTRIQLWLLYHLVSQTIFDIWDVILSEMEDTTRGLQRSPSVALCSLDHFLTPKGGFTQVPRDTGRVDRCYY